MCQCRITLMTLYYIVFTWSWVYLMNRYHVLSVRRAESKVDYGI